MTEFSGSGPEPQTVIEPQGMAAHFVVLGIAPGPEAEDKVRAFFGNAAGLVRSVSRRQPEERLSMVVPYQSHRGFSQDQFSA